MIRPKYETESRHNSTTKKSKPISREAYRAVATRSGGICERCMVEVAIHMHHRKFRSRGGMDTVSNIVHLCQTCHLWAHSEGIEATDNGWAIATGGNPEGLAIHVGESWFFLQESGRRIRCTSVEAVTALANAGSLHIKGTDS